MQVDKSGLFIDNPAIKLLDWLASFEGITTSAGNALGTTLVCTGLAAEPSYDGLVVKILDGGAAGQPRTIQVHNGNTLIVGAAFTDPTGAVQQIAAGTRFVILSSLTGGGPGPAPAEGLVYYGVVDAVPGANQFTISALAGLGAGKFAGATNPYQAFVLRDAGGASAVPQGEILPVTAYTTATGNFATAAFTAAIAIGDEVLIVHPSLASIITILASLNVPPADSLINLLERDVIGNKADTALYAATATASLMRYLKSVLHTEVLAIGTFTTSSATVPADTGRTEANDAWKGCLLMPLVAGAGPTAFQPKRIVTFTNAGGIFTMDPGNPFTSATGLVAYAILPAQADFVPAADSARNISTPEVVGNKTDAAVTAVGVVASVIAYVKGIINLVVAGFAAIPAQCAAALAAVAYTRQAGVAQVKATTIDLNQAAATYDLLTGTTQDVLAEKLIIRMSGGAIGGALTSISIQTDDTTPQVFISAANGVVANLTDQNQLGYDGVILIKAGKKIRLTIAGGAAGVARVCDVVVLYSAVVSGGYLA